MFLCGSKRFLKVANIVLHDLLFVLWHRFKVPCSPCDLLFVLQVTLKVNSVFHDLLFVL